MKKNTKQQQAAFAKELVKICELFKGKHKTDDIGRVMYSFKTCAGTLTAIVSGDNDYLFTIFQRFENDFDKDAFTHRIGARTGLNSYSFKWNIHEEDMHEALWTFKRRLELLTEKELA